MKKLFFRDKGEHAQELDVIAHGVVYAIHGEGQKSLKDYACIFMDPMSLTVGREWRSKDEVVTMEAMPGTYEEFLYDNLLLALENRDKQ